MHKDQNVRDWTRLGTWPLVGFALAVIVISPRQVELSDGTVLAGDILLATLIMGGAYAIVAALAAALFTTVSKKPSTLNLPFSRLTWERSLVMLGSLLIAFAIKGFGYHSFPPLLYVGFYIGLTALSLWFLRSNSFAR